MTVPEEERLVTLIENAVASGIQRHTLKFGNIEPEQHYRDHLLISSCYLNQAEMRKNHEFVTSWRGYAEAGKRKGFLFFITALGGFVVWMGVEAIRHWTTR